MSITTHAEGRGARVFRSPSAITASVILGLLLCFCVLAPGTAAAGPAKGGICDQRLESALGVGAYGLTLTDVPGVADVPGAAAEIGAADRLDSDWTRVLVHWARLQPKAPGVLWSGDADQNGYADEYEAELDAVVGALHVQGVNVILTGIDVPQWASDRRYWVHKKYDADVVMAIDKTLVRTQFARFARYLSSHFGLMGVRYLEVWNEPNLGSGIFPQRGGGSPVGLKVYVKMLKVFYAGARQGSSHAFVIAGGTAPRGTNNEYSTTPQSFAKYLMASGAGRYFNGYSHHPYTPKGSRNAAPNLLPNNPTRCVTLGNLSTLLKIVPKKPFFITEYGYNTEYSALFGLEVTREQQAEYLTKAYQMVAANPRVKTLIWYLVPDWQPDAANHDNGAYCGLVGVDGLRKPGWYAFAGGNAVTLIPPTPVAAGVTFGLAGTLTGKVAVDAHQQVILQSRASVSSPWATVGTQRTSDIGAFVFSISQTQATDYRVLWDGVNKVSDPLTVPLATP